MARCRSKERRTALRSSCPKKCAARIHRWAGIPAMPAAVPPDPIIPVAAKSPDPIAAFGIRAHWSFIDQRNKSVFADQEASQQDSKRAPFQTVLSKACLTLCAQIRVFAPCYRRSRTQKSRIEEAFLELLAVVDPAVVLAAGVFVFNNKRQVGASMIRLGERLSGEYSQQPAGSVPPAVTRSSVTSAPGPPEFATVEPLIRRAFGDDAKREWTLAPPNSGLQKRQRRPINSACSQTEFRSGIGFAGTESRAARSTCLGRPRSKIQMPLILLYGLNTRHPRKITHRRSDEPARQDDGHTELALARQYLRGSTVPKDRDMAAHLLWVAVGDGNPASGAGIGRSLPPQRRRPGEELRPSAHFAQRLVQ